MYIVAEMLLHYNKHLQDLNVYDILDFNNTMFGWSESRWSG